MVVKRLGWSMKQPKFELEQWSSVFVQFPIDQLKQLYSDRRLQLLAPARMKEMGDEMQKKRLSILLLVALAVVQGDVLWMKVELKSKVEMRDELKRKDEDKEPRFADPSISIARSWIVKVEWRQKQRNEKREAVKMKHRGANWMRKFLQMTELSLVDAKERKIRRREVSQADS